VGVYFGDVDVGSDFSPLVILDVVGEDEIAAVDGAFLSPEDVNRRSVDDCAVGFKFYGLALAFIVQLGPPVLLDFLADIDAVEVNQHALVGVEPPVDIEPVFVYNGDMIRSGRNVLTLNFDLSPTSIERVL
jgi:hypothetical protein